MTTPNTIAMVHYHLRRGGVTRVIQNAVAALSDSGMRCVVVAGEAPPSDVDFGVPVAVVEGLGYDEGGAPVTADSLLKQVRHTVGTVLETQPDIWHIHNHTLGKNPAWTEGVHQLAEQGERLVLQIHDFPEDGRPRNYLFLNERVANLESRLYPCTARTHYALLNRRDHDVLREAGLSDRCAHLLPNAVWTGEETASHADTRDPQAPLYLYPTRAIRRKNIGEFLLWSAVEQGAGRYGITLAPESAGEKKAYARWKELARSARLPVTFEMGLQQDFSSLLASASALFTTSMAEGFGLAFLEPWLADRPLAGRNLPEITREFAEQGIDLNNLYTELMIPLDWIDVGRFRERVRTALTDARAAYGLGTGDDEVERAVIASIVGDRIDFGRLDESFQEDVIERVQHNGPDGMHPYAIPSLVSRDLVASNRERVAAQYGLKQYGERLRRLYAAVMGADEPVDGVVSAAAVLHAFSAPERFVLLRT